MTKLLFIDTETTGLNPDLHGVHQLGGIIVQDEVISKDSPVVDEFNMFANPFNQPGMELATWTEKDGTVKDALSVSGVTKEQVEQYPAYEETFHNLVNKLNKHIDRYNKNDKFILVGYNIEFDADMLRGYAKRLGYKYINSYLSYQTIDVMDIVRLADIIGVLPSKPQNHKLETMCELLNIEIQAHDALSDIRATKELLFALLDLLQQKID